jgi:hypothetical protein
MAYQTDPKLFRNILNWFGEVSKAYLLGIFDILQKLTINSRTNLIKDLLIANQK